MLRMALELAGLRAVECLLNALVPAQRSACVIGVDDARRRDYHNS
jgi:hypothetical protein